MTLNPSILDVNRVADYTPGVLTTNFAITWPVYFTDGENPALDLNVQVAGVDVPFTFSGTPISGLSGVYNGGTVTLLTGVSGQRVIIWSQRDPRRLGYFLEGKSLPMSELDKLQNDFAVQMRDLDFKADRAIKLTPQQFLDGVNPDTILAGITTSAASAAASAASAATSAAAATGLVYLFVNTLTALKAISAVAAAITPNAVMRSYAGTLGDGAYGTFYWNATDTRTDDGATIINPTGYAGTGRWNRVIQGFISVNWWNPPIDQTGDAGPALRSAIAAAVVWQVREIRCFGKMQFTTQICNATFGWELPGGLTFRGVGQQIGLAGTGNSNALWVYNGTANTDMFDIRGADGTGATSQTTNILFQDIQIATAVSTGFMSINILRQGGATYTPGVGTFPNCAQNVKFKNIKAAGHFNRWFLLARTAFEITVDDDCHIENFLRGVQLSGCDDCVISGRYDGNASRHIMLEKQGTYGNQNRIRANFLGAITAGDVSELHYGVYDTAEGTVMDTIYAEIGGDTADAFLYLGGSGTNIICPKMFGITGTPALAYFRLGAFGVNIKMICPETSLGSSIAHPIIEAQDSSTYFASAGFDNYNIQIINPSTSVTARVNTDMRCTVVNGSTKLVGTNRAALPQMGLSANGVGLARYQATAQDPANAAPLIAGFTGIVSDANAGNYQGQVIQMPTTNNDGLYWRFVANRDFTVLDQLKALALVRCTTVPGAGNISLQWRKNGVLQGAPATHALNTYGVLSKTFDTTGMATNDTLDIVIFNNGMSIAGLIGMMEMINTSH